MLIILRLAVLPHKHPHELLDSVVKEQWLILSSQPRRAFYSSLIFRQVVFRSYFPKKTFLLNRLRLRSASGISLAGGEFYSVSNRCQPPLSPPPITSTETPTSSNHHLVSPAHSTQLSLLYNPSFYANFLFYKRFAERPAPEEVRIIGPTETASSIYWKLFTSSSNCLRSPLNTYSRLSCCDHGFHRTEFALYT